MVTTEFSNNDLAALAKIIGRRSEGGPLMQKLAAYLDDCSSLGGTSFIKVKLTAEPA